MGWASLIKSIASLWASVMTYLNNQKLMDAGGAKAELEGIKKADEIIADIAVKRADDSVRERTKKKYQRD
jgi:hypothetical protein